MIKTSRYFFTLGLLILSGCGAYNNQFQCRAGNGLNCVAAGEVVDLIVEREEGKTSFSKTLQKQTVPKRSRKPKRQVLKRNKKLLRNSS